MTKLTSFDWLFCLIFYDGWFCVRIRGRPIYREIVADKICKPQTY